MTTTRRQRLNAAAQSSSSVGPSLLVLALALSALSACGGGSGGGDARYPERSPGCAVQVFRGKIAGIVYDDIGRADAICGNDIGQEACLDELRNQACKLGGDLVYDVPDEPQRPTPDKIRFTGRVAHTRAQAPQLKRAAP